MGIGQGQRLPPPGTKVPLGVEPPGRPGAPRALHRTALGEDQSEAPGHGRSPTPGAEPLIQERAQPGGGLAEAFQQSHIRQRGHAGPAAALRWSRATHHSRRTPGSSAGRPRRTPPPASGSWPPGSRRHPATRGARTGATTATAPPGTRVAACGPHASPPSSRSHRGRLRHVRPRILYGTTHFFKVSAYGGPSTALRMALQGGTGTAEPRRFPHAPSLSAQCHQPDAGHRT